ncbi:hypothetical protein [Echinicola salinicaeni]|uniref:hypothetical protein n=1 Tax=Echinicola salinicaeni TaxID=2762757 RepID=UPI001647C805|nr:hypothetical protein [Echinicola salinicaeni]
MSIFNDPLIQKKLENLFTSGFSQGSFGGVKGDQIQFLFSWPPEVLDDSQYANPWSANHPQGLMSATENISKLVNPIPLLSKNFTPSPNSIESIYGNIILNASPVELTKEIASRTNTRVSTFQNTLNDKGLTSNRIQKKIDTKKDLMLSQERESLLELERKISLEIADNIISGKATSSTTNKSIKSLQGLRSQFSRNHEQAFARSFAATVRQLPLAKKSVPSTMLKELATEDNTPLIVNILHNANALFRTSAVSSVNNPNTSYHPSYITPYNFADLNASKSWPEVNTTLTDSYQNNIEVSFSYTRADIERPWFLGYIMTMNGWTINGQSPGWLSTGNTDNNPGIFPLLPVSFLLCRNIKISGPKSNYEANGLQIIARCCQITPKMSPD